VADGRGRLLRVALPVNQAEPVAGAADVAGLANAGGWVWATSGGSLLRIDPVDGRVAARVPDPRVQIAAPASALASGQDSLWLAGAGGSGARLVRLDQGTGQSKRFIRLPALAEMYRPKLAVGQRVVAARVGQQLRLIDPATDKIRATVNLHNTTGGVAADGKTIWATESPFGRLLRIDPGF
jgi:sugar lactone lactonase YvrE